MVKDHSDSEKGNLLPPHRLLLSINSKGSFICTIPQTGYHIPQPLLPLVEHWLEREIAQRVRPLSNSNMSLVVSGLLSDAGMMFVASQLGFEWTLVTLSLGLTQAQIEQIQMSYPQQAFRQITTALTTWRDARDVSDDEKISQLLTTFETEEIGKTELAELIRERYGLWTDSRGDLRTLCAVFRLVFFNCHKNFFIKFIKLIFYNCISSTVIHRNNIN